MIVGGDVGVSLTAGVGVSVSVGDKVSVGTSVSVGMSVSVGVGVIEGVKLGVSDGITAMVGKIIGVCGEQAPPSAANAINAVTIAIRRSITRIVRMIDAKRLPMRSIVACFGQTVHVAVRCPSARWRSGVQHLRR